MNTTQTETLAELIERLRSLSIDHGPKGWPAVRTRDVTALLDRIAELEAQLEAVGAGGVSGPLMGRAALSANAGSEPVAWRIDWPDEPELGHYFSEAPTDSGRCQPLYLHPYPPEGMAGWKLVPIEPTPAMLAAVVTSMDDFLLGKEAEKQYREDWAAMLAAAPTAQAAGSVLEDAALLTSEQEYAIRQGHEIAASDGYFDARPQIESKDRRKVFQAGFERGWDAARKQGANHD